MVQELIAKRNTILGEMQRMHDQLIEVNNQVADEVEKINGQILALQTEAVQLGNLKTQNSVSIKNLKRILG